MFNGQERLIIGIVVIVYFAFLFGFSIYVNRRVKTYDDYNVAGRSVSVFPLILTFVGTAIGGSTLLGYMENGYMYGMGQQWLKFSSILTSILILFFLVKRIRKLGEKYNMVTIGDFTALRYGEKARLPTVISILVAYCSITGMQFIAVATLLHLTLGLSITLGIVIGWALLTLKTYFGGLKAVIWQDAVHGTVQTICIFMLFVVVYAVAGGWGNITQNAKSFQESDMLSVFNISSAEFFVYLLTIGGYQFVRQDVWQRFWAAKDYKTTINGFWLSILLSFLTGVFVITLGVMGRYGLNLGNIDPTLIYYEIVGNVLPFPFVIIMIIALMATVISCADSFFMAGASSIVNDIIKPRLKRTDQKKMLQYSQMSVVMVSIIALVLALYIPQLVNLWVTGTAMLVSGLLAPVLLGVFWKRATKIAGVLSMWIGLIIAVLWQMSGHPFGIHPVFIGLPLSLLTLLIISFITKDNNGEELFSEIN